MEHTKLNQHSQPTAEALPPEIRRMLSEVLRNQRSQPSSEALPPWVRVPVATKISSIGRSTLFDLVKQGRIASRLVKTSPHNSSGIRLISTQSLFQFIEEGE